MLFAAEMTLRSEAFTCTDDWSGYITISKDLLATASAGDTLNIYVSDISTTATYPQVYLQYVGAAWQWLDFQASHTCNLSGLQAPYKASIPLTQSMLDVISSGLYLVVKGVGYTADLVTLTHVPANVGTTSSLWVGSVAMPSSWGAWQTIPASSFAHAEVGQFLRMRFTDLTANAQLQLKETKGWTELVDAPLMAISGRYYDYTITADMLAQLQVNGVIISGCNYTLTEVLLINPAEQQSLTLSVPVVDKWVFSDRPSLTIHITNPYRQAMSAYVEVEIMADRAELVTTIRDTVQLPAGANRSIVVTTDHPLAPGFYKATCMVNEDLARAFFFAINPFDIVSAPDKQPDFETYWATAKKQLDAISIKAKLTELPAKSTPARKVYLVEMRSIPDGLSGRPVIIRGYYCEPQDGKKHPVIMHYLGYDSGYRPGNQDVKPYCPSGDDQPNYAEFYLSTRGQSINNRAANEREADGKGDLTNTYGDWFAFHFGDKDSYYYRGAYMDCVRAIQFMATRPTSDMNNLYAEGQSQGGAFTYAAASLSGYTFRAIAPGVAFMGDFPDYFRIVNWPAYVARANQGNMTDKQMYAFLSYYDTKNLAATISCPVIACLGLQDDVCPPHTNIAPYNNLQSVDKILLFNPENGHQVSSTWYNDYTNFFEIKYNNTYGTVVK